MKRGKLTLVAVVLSGSLLFSSCVGSFGLFNRLSSWNQSVGNKFVNELVFLAFNIVPVYGVAYLSFFDRYSEMDWDSSSGVQKHSANAF